MHRAVPWLCVVAGCGRFGFGSWDPTGDGPHGDVPVIGDATPHVPCTVGHPSALLCEGFEDPAVMWDYTAITNGHAARSTARAVLGTASFNCSTDTLLDYKSARWGKNDVLPGITNGEYYLRELVFMPASTVVTDQLSIMVTGNRVDPFPSANLLLRPGEISAVVEGNEYPVAMEFPRDRWVCVELHVHVDDSTGHIDVAFDGTQIIAATGVDTGVAGGYTNIDVGVHYATPDQDAAELWVDELVADTRPVGCN